VYKHVVNKPAHGGQAVAVTVAGAHREGVSRSGQCGRGSAVVASTGSSRGRYDVMHSTGQDMGNMFVPCIMTQDPVAFSDDGAGTQTAVPYATASDVAMRVTSALCAPNHLDVGPKHALAKAVRVEVELVLHERLKV
jgi:hypothetical protein